MYVLVSIVLDSITADAVFAIVISVTAFNVELETIGPANSSKKKLPFLKKC
jgi:hypothetical protein